LIGDLDDSIKEEKEDSPEIQQTPPSSRDNSCPVPPYQVMKKPNTEHATLSSKSGMIGNPALSRGVSMQVEGTQMNKNLIGKLESENDSLKDRERQKELYRQIPL